jgi:hypothetical protein
MATTSKKVSEIREVAAFVEAQQRLQTFREQHADVFAEFGELVEEYNGKLEAADKAVRGHGVTCGPFVLQTVVDKYDAKALYDALGRDDFLEFGGKLSTQTIYEVDKNHLKAAIQSGALPPEVVSVVHKAELRYKKPGKVEL